MDEYQLEIQSLRRQLSKLKSEKADAGLIDEYEAELRNLVALYDAATSTFAQGGSDERLSSALDMLGYGQWTFDSVYSFVYEAAVEADTGGRDLANVISHTDYAASLVLALGGENTTR